MRPRLAWCAAVLAGCAFDASGVQPGAPDADPNAPDADVTAPDADPSAPDAGCAVTLAFAPANVEVCDLPGSMGDFQFTADAKNVIDTDTNTIRQGGAVITGLAHGLVTQPGSSLQAMVIVADDLTIESAAEVAVVGARPLIIVALGNLRVDGVLDASATAAVGGAGHDLACETGAGTDGATQLGNQAVPIPGGAGGGGAGFGGVGGIGARISPQTVPDPPTAAGAAWGTTTLSPLVGGCTGGDGGVGSIANTPAAGGGGGGGLELVAAVEVRIDGTVTVSGGGGGGAGVGATLEFAGGGGGGGSGGALLVQAPMIKVMSGELTANGGAGGEGRRDGDPGMPGADGLSDDDVAAIGGSGVAGGNGGAGGAGALDATAGEVGTGAIDATAGGGGGGGAVGRILLRGTTISLTGNEVVSPAAVTDQL